MSKKLKILKTLKDNEILLERVETPDYILWVSNEEIKKSCYFFNGERILQASRITDIVIDNEGQWSEIKSSKKIITYQPKGNAKELDLPLLPEVVVKNPISEDRIYCVDVQNFEYATAPQTWDDKKFISEAKIQGNVYSLEGFIAAFNKTEINQDNLIIRHIKADKVVEADVEKLALEWFVEANKKEIIFDSGWTKIFEAGYESANKKYSEEDVVEICYKLFKHTPSNELQKWEKRHYLDFIQSLKQPKPKYFIAETSGGGEYLAGKVGGNEI
jgi:hypothetical protein